MLISNLLTQQPVLGNEVYSWLCNSGRWWWRLFCMENSSGITSVSYTANIEFLEFGMNFYSVKENEYYSHTEDIFPY